MSTKSTEKSTGNYAEATHHHVKASAQTAQMMDSMQNVMEAMVKFSSAMAMFGVQQIKNSADVALDPQHGADRFAKQLKDLTSQLEGAMDEGNRATSKKLGTAAEDILTSWRGPAIDPSEFFQTGIEAFRNFIDAMTGVAKKTASSLSEAAKDGEAAAQAKA